jgi:hypothetical protein
MKHIAQTFYSQHGGSAFLRDVGLWVVTREKSNMEKRLTTQNETKSVKVPSYQMLPDFRKTVNNTSLFKDVTVTMR